MTGVSVASSALWLRRFHPAPDQGPRLVCFPHAGGAASYYFKLSRMLHPFMEVVAVQYPGRHDRRSEAPVENIARLADLITAELKATDSRPTLLFGHSMGALVAFEVARAMEQGGIAPLTLITSGRRAPSTTRATARPMHLHDDAEIVEELRALDGTNSQVLENQQLLEMILPALRSDYRAVETYRYVAGPRLFRPIVSLVGMNDPQATIDEAQAWSRHTAGGFTLHVFDGGHFYLDTHAEAVAQVIRNHSAEDVS
ncbi:thioesterase II family protein [Streptomyces sp. NPDC048419]|uniref:thioesterase II family protein n=1 Tax=Streptomyces sp. NPDC048419 TaxID=3365547 RepID=UPI00371062B4